MAGDLIAPFEPLIDDVTVAIEWVGPERARGLLAGNRQNRSLRPSRVRNLSAAMNRGEWDLNGESIKVDADGSLLDGQHRLAAVVEAGATVQMLVVTGLPREAQETVDTGRRRRLADVLAIRGEPAPHALAAALNLLHRYRQNARLDASKAGAPTPQQALDLLEQCPGLRDSVRVGRRVARQLPAPASIFSTLHFVFSEIDPDATETFFESLTSGADLRSDDPVFHLRRHLLRPRRDRGSSQHAYLTTALTIKAFNFSRQGRRVELLSFKTRGSKSESFPIIERFPERHS